tara:strand:+ start:289 stop:756 length:468 start_codon:yes stop_codon:yes gene_type:complete
MADAALATQSRSATNVSRVERSSARGTVKPVRAVGETDAFNRNVNVSGGLAGVSSGQSAQEQPAGGGLLSNGVQMLLAETRTQEAGAPSVAPSSVGRALNSYLTTQAKVRETIRDSLAFGAQSVVAQTNEASDGQDSRTSAGTGVHTDLLRTATA